MPRQTVLGSLAHACALVLSLSLSLSMVYVCVHVYIHMCEHVHRSQMSTLFVILVYLTF